ncbi:MAG: DNRLRE domain-containing protein [Rhodoferax sp.]|nr:DNRLRE domain-containing protein [Rhodoferax sp.]
MTAIVRSVARLLGLVLAGVGLVWCGDAGVSMTLPPALPLVTAGEPYRATLYADGAQLPLEWQVSDDELPPGLSLNRITGVIEGQASKVGRYELHVTVRDGAYRQSSAVVKMEVIAPDIALVPDALRDGSRQTGKALPSSAQVSGLQSLLASMPEGSWVQASLNRYADVWAPEELRPLDVNGMGATPPSKIIAAWSGYAWDSNRGDLILYGGGHANHPGNDVYRWRGSTRQWERAALPSEIVRDASGNLTAIDGPDAAPAAAHTYDNNIFLPVVDRFLTFGGAAYNNGGAYRRATSGGQSRNTGPYLWDPAKADPNKVGGATGSHVKRVSPHAEIVGGQMWQNRDFALNLAGNASLPALHLEGCTGYANEGGLDVVYAGARLGYGTATQLFRYVLRDLNRPQLDTWTQLGGYWDAPQGQTACTFDPVQKVFVRLGNAATPFSYWDTAAPGGNSNYEKRIVFAEPTGDFQARLNDGRINIRYCGFDFDPQRRQYALWCGGADVWLLTPPASVSPTGWTLQKQALGIGGGATPTSDTGTGILGKWKYIPNLDAFMALQDSIAGNIWIYKPFGWVPPDGGTPSNQLPTVSWVSPTAGQQFTAGQVVPLQVNATDADGSVAAVDFYDGANLLAHVSAAPWRFDWPNAAPGSHTLSAIAYDNQGANQSAPAISIAVVQASGGVLVLQDGLNGYAGTRDANLASNAVNINYGTLPTMMDIYRYSAMVVRFAVFQREGGPVPDNAIVSAAELELYKSTSYSVTMSAYRMLCDWQELQVTWSSCRTGTAWSVPGAFGAGSDYQAVADGAGLATWSPGWLKINVTAGLVAMQSGAPNYGWRLRRTAGDDINIKRYYAREYMDNTSLRPRLVVHYTRP